MPIYPLSCQTRDVGAAALAAALAGSRPAALAYGTLLAWTASFTPGSTAPDRCFHLTGLHRGPKAKVSVSSLVSSATWLSFDHRQASQARTWRLVSGKCVSDRPVPPACRPAPVHRSETVDDSAIRRRTVGRIPFPLKTGLGSWWTGDLAGRSTRRQSFRSLCCTNGDGGY